MADSSWIVAKQGKIVVRTQQNQNKNAHKERSILACFISSPNITLFRWQMISLHLLYFSLVLLSQYLVFFVLSTLILFINSWLWQMLSSHFDISRYFCSSAFAAAIRPSFGNTFSPQLNLTIFTLLIGDFPLIALSSHWCGSGKGPGRRPGGAPWAWIW